jgi:dienelactone hydrolase
VAAWVASIGEAAAELRTRSGVSQIALAGVRLGGTLAVAAAHRADADALILVAAHATGRPYARELRALGRLMRTQGDVEGPEPTGESAEEVAGFTIMPETMADLSGLDPFVGVVGIRRAFVVPRDDVAPDMTVADRLAQHGVDVERAALPGYAAMMVDAHESVAPSEIIDASVRWLGSHYSAASLAVSVSRFSSTGEPVDGAIDHSVRERAVVFDDARGLFGVLSQHSNEVSRCESGIILANAGSVHTAGPGRLYVELAREWASRGFSVLRLDLGGVGDSDVRAGTADNHPYPDHAVADISLAAQWMRAHAGVSRVVVAGLCSGAHASFHAGRALDQLAGIISINPIVFYWNPACALDVSAWMNYYESRRYSRSVREVGSWVRLMRGEVNVRHAASVGYRRMREVTGGAATAFRRRLGLVRHDPENVAADFARMSERGVDVLLVFSEGDPGLDFVQRRYARDLTLLQHDRTNFVMQVVADADHTFTRRESRARLVRLLTDHLLSRHFRTTSITASR